MIGNSNQNYFGNIRIASLILLLLLVSLLSAISRSKSSGSCIRLYHIYIGYGAGISFYTANILITSRPHMEVCIKNLYSLFFNCTRMDSREEILSLVETVADRMAHCLFESVNEYVEHLDQIFVHCADQNLLRCNVLLIWDKLIDVSC